MLFLQLLINGIQAGALYALIAVGFSLIFGTTRIFHFAHGATFTIAAYVFYHLYAVMHLHWSVAVLACATAAVLFGLALNRWVYIPIQKHEGSFFTVFVAAFGVSILVENLCGMVFGRSYVSVDTPLSRSVEIVHGLYVSPLSGVAIVIALLFFGGLHVFLMRTHTGMALRALSDNPELVRAYGMSPRRLSMSVFALGSLLVVVPGLVTTVAGLLLLLPPSRAVARPVLTALATRGIGRRFPLITVATVGADRHARRPQPDYIDGEVIDVSEVVPPALPLRPE